MRRGDGGGASGEVRVGVRGLGVGRLRLFRGLLRGAIVGWTVPWRGLGRGRMRLWGVCRGIGIGALSEREACDGLR